MDENWLSLLQHTVRKRHLIAFQFNAQEWYHLRKSARGMTEFTIARSHDTLGKLQVPTACLIFCTDCFEAEAYFGLISSRSPISTLESRIKVRRSQRIRPSSKAELFKLVTEKRHSKSLRDRLASDNLAIALPPELSALLIQKLAKSNKNRGPMRLVAASLASPNRCNDMASLQQNAIQTALRAFNLSSDDQADSLNLVRGKKTALERVNIVEDSVVEHDARHVPGYNLIGSDITGRAVFKKDSEMLEVYTANRRPLEKVFGVDLIYLNTTRQNIVMLQYKMLERSKNGDEEDWIYRPDNKLELEIERMRKFQGKTFPSRYEYRLNPEVFYLRFVQRDGYLKKAGITIPVEHFEQLRADPSCQGPRGGFHISFKSLAGRYLRQTAFLDLVRSGYIGAHAETTDHLKELVRAVVERNGKAIVAAIQSQKDDNEIGKVLVPMALSQGF